MANPLPAHAATPPSSRCNPEPGAFSAAKCTSPQRRQRCANEVETALSRSLRQENDLLRCQLDELITHETNQRVEVQRLSHQRDAQVASMVQASTAQLKAEVEQLKSILQSTSSQLLQVLSETEQAKTQKDEIERALEEAKLSGKAHENQLKQRLQSFEQVLDSAVITAATLVDTVEGFQRHVLPTFKTSGFENGCKAPLKVTSDVVTDGKAFMEQLSKLEHGLALLKVLVDAKNDTLVLIRGKLKQENEELRAELQLAKTAAQSQEQTLKATNPINNGTIRDNSTLSQELRELQSLFNEEVKHLKSKLKAYESEEQQGQDRLTEVQKELTTLREKLSTVEASKNLLETNLKEETSARSQLVSQLVALGKENEKMLAELETLKLSQKFLVRQPRGGLPAEKMDLQNTVKQLLAEMNKLKGEKVALEEELKSQGRFRVQDHAKRLVTSRDAEMGSSSKVGGTVLVSKSA